jgi:hypothetical protein
MKRLDAQATHNPLIQDDTRTPTEEVILGGDPSAGVILRSERGDFPMNWRSSGAWPLLVVILVVAAAPAVRASERREEPRYRIAVDAVLLELRVTEPGGKPISDLLETDFEVSQNDEPRAIVFFEEFSSRPLSLAILLDVGSAMSEENVRNGKQLIFDLIHVLPPEDEVLVGLYCDFKEPPPEWNPDKKGIVELLADLTKDRFRLLRAVENLTIGDRPSRFEFFDKGSAPGRAIRIVDFYPSNSQTGSAVDYALVKLRRATHPNRSVLVISAGLPNIGEGTLDHLSRAEAVLFEVAFGYKVGDVLDLGLNSRDRKKIIRLTAGASYSAESVVFPIERFRDNLKHSYLLAFRPEKGTEVELEKVLEEVKIRVPSHPEARVSSAGRSTRALDDWWRGD